jgi:threonine/homoserine/homoserine lactone efflux protein
VTYAGSLLALAVLTLLPGPDVAVVTRVALAHGRAAAFRTTLGIVTGLLVWGTLTVAGLAAVLAASAAAYAVVRVAGAGYLVVLGVLTLWRSGRPLADEPAGAVALPLRGAWRTGFVSNVLNPKIGVFYTAVLPTPVPDGAPHTATLVSLVLAHAAMGVVWLATLAALLDRAARVVRRPSVRRAMERVTGVVLVAFGLRVAVE